MKAKLDPETEAALAAAELPENYFELYKLAVEMADRISARRGLANSFFLTVNTGVVAFVAARNVRWYLPVAGIVFSVTWWALLRSYRELNSAKFDVILAMKERLPVRVYREEWDRLRRPRSASACGAPLCSRGSGNIGNSAGLKESSSGSSC